jgi:hypothetical protein
VTNRGRGETVLMGNTGVKTFGLRGLNVIIPVPSGNTHGSTWTKERSISGRNAVEAFLRIYA